MYCRFRVYGESTVYGITSFAQALYDGAAEEYELERIFSLNGIFLNFFYEKNKMFDC